MQMTFCFAVFGQDIAFIINDTHIDAKDATAREKLMLDGAVIIIQIRIRVCSISRTERASFRHAPPLLHRNAEILLKGPQKRFWQSRATDERFFDGR